MGWSLVRVGRSSSRCSGVVPAGGLGEAGTMGERESGRRRRQMVGRTQIWCHGTKGGADGSRFCWLLPSATSRERATSGVRLPRHSGGTGPDASRVDLQCGVVRSCPALAIRPLCIASHGLRRSGRVCFHKRCAMLECLAASWPLTKRLSAKAGAGGTAFRPTPSCERPLGRKVPNGSRSGCSRSTPRPKKGANRDAPHRSQGMRVPRAHTRARTRAACAGLQDGRSDSDP